MPLYFPRTLSHSYSLLLTLLDASPAQLTDARPVLTIPPSAADDTLHQHRGHYEGTPGCLCQQA